MNNDEARKYFKNSGLTYNAVNKESLKYLRSIIDKELKSSKLFKGKYKCSNNIIFQDNKYGFFGGILCDGDYFESREAVSFNRDGFIGFAGWASSENTAPIITGFIKWVDSIKRQQARSSKRNEQR